MSDDRTVILFASAGLAVHLGAFALRWTAIGWRWPAVAAASVVALGIGAVVLVWSRRLEPPHLALLAVQALALIAALAVARSPSRPAAWALGAGSVLQVLILILLLAFMLFFRMRRLW